MVTKGWRVGLAGELGVLARLRRVVREVGKSIAN